MSSEKGLQRVARTIKYGFSRITTAGTGKTQQEAIPLLDYTREGQVTETEAASHLENIPSKQSYNEASQEIIIPQELFKTNVYALQETTEEELLREKLAVLLADTNKERPSEDLTRLQLFCRLSLVIIWLAVYYVAMISSQISSLPSNIFSFTSLRFSIQFLVLVPVVICKRYPLVINKQHIYLVIAATLSNVTFASAFFVAAAYMPLGNLDAIYVACYAAVSVMVDFCRGSISWRSVVVGAVACSGIVIIVQPWSASVMGNAPTPSVPCNYLDNTSAVWNIPIYSMANDSIHYKNAAGSKNKVAISYMLVILAAIGMTALGNSIKRLVSEYPIPTVMFWLALTEALTSFLIARVWTSVEQETYFSFPEGAYCLVFTWLFIVCSEMSHSLSYFAYSYFTISGLALGHVAVSLSLYISQRTFLKVFYPGHANTVEVLGVLVVLFGIVILPTIFLMLQEHRKRKSSSKPQQWLFLYK